MRPKTAMRRAAGRGNRRSGDDRGEHPRRWTGFDPAAQTEGFGVLGMRERAALLHGTLEIESAPGQGTTVRCILPVQRRSEPRTAQGPAAAPASRLTQTEAPCARGKVRSKPPVCRLPLARRARLTCEPIGSVERQPRSPSSPERAPTGRAVPMHRERGFYLTGTRVSADGTTPCTEHPG